MNLETISSNFYLLVRNECSMIISNICSDPLICESYPDIYNLENYLTEKYLPSKVKLLHSQMKKKTKLQENERCLAIKKDTEQCTRRRRVGINFCGKHILKQPYGIINDDNINNDDYISVIPEMFDGTEYLVDENKNVYTNNLECPERVGQKISQGVCNFSK